MNYIADGAVITNRLLFTDQREIDDIMGGSGLYAYSGLRMCTPDSMLVSGVGRDFDQFYGEWFGRNGCVRDGLLMKVDKTTYNELIYYPDDHYDEYSIYGREYERENLPKTVVTALDLAPFLRDAKGIHISGRMDEQFTQEIARLKSKHGFRIMWEVPESVVDELAGIYSRKGLGGIQQELAAVDLFSCNRPESFRIFGAHTEEEAIGLLKQLEKPVYYRVGKNGAYMIEAGREYFVPMISTVPPEQEIDPTGCGNSSTAAAMWAYCEGFDPLMTCVIGNVVASYNVRQYGPYPDMSRAAFDQMMAEAEKIYRDLK